MEIKSSTKTYVVSIEDEFSFLDTLFEEKNKMVVIDRKVYELYPQLFSSLPSEQLVLLDALEENKTIETALELCERLTSIPAKRNAHLISIGGGIIQDITGFAANILYRGIRWTFVPTTLLAACDSCIGGKTSLNYKKYKNLLGTFYPPDKIYICSKFFGTLSERDFKSGLGEVVKFNIMFGEEGLCNIEAKIDKLLDRTHTILDEVVYNSLHFKKAFIEQDEFDKGERVKLNFAHTFGHAFETVSCYEIPHGTAVAMGMIVADRIAMRRGHLTRELVERMENVLLQIIPKNYDQSWFVIDNLIDAVRKDKKQVDSNITAVLFNEKMNLEICHDIKQEEIEQAMLELRRLLN